MKEETKNFFTTFTFIRWLSLGSGLFLGFVSAFVIVWVAYNVPSTIVYDTHQMDAVVTEGGNLYLIGTKREKPNCITDVIRWLYRPDPEIPGHFEWHEITSSPHSPPVLDGLPYRLVVPISSNIPAGKWKYFAQFYDRCNAITGPTVRESAIFPVEIVKGEPDSSLRPDYARPADQAKPAEAPPPAVNSWKAP